MKYQHYYILFQNHTDAMAMYRGLNQASVFARISPTPRELSISCGVSLLVKEEELDKIKALAIENNWNYLQISGLNNTFDNSRHKYG